MRLKLKCKVAVGGEVRDKGETVDVDEPLASRLIGVGLAERKRGRPAKDENTSGDAPDRRADNGGNGEAAH